MSRRTVLLSLFLAGASGSSILIAAGRALALPQGRSPAFHLLLGLACLGGAALGASWAGRRRPPAPRQAPYRLPGLVLLVGAAAGALAPHLAGFLEPVLGAVYRLNDGSPSHPLFIGALALQAAILVPAAFAAGAAFPLVVRRLAAGGETGVWTGAAATLSLLGATAGVELSITLPSRVGLLGLLAGAAGLQALVGAAMALSRAPGSSAPGSISSGPAPAEASPAASPAMPGLTSREGGAPLPTRAVFWPLVLAGAAGGLLFPAWMRLLGLSLGGNPWTLGLVLGCLLPALAAGALLGATFADRLGAPRAALGWALVGAALIIGAAIPALGVFPVQLAHRLSRMDTESMSYMLFLFAGALEVVILTAPPMVFLGMALPILARLGGSAPGGGISLERAMTALLLGGAAGFALLQAALLPLLGVLWSGPYLAAALWMAAGLVLVLREPAFAGRFPVRLGSGALAALVLLGFSVLHRPWGILDGKESRQRYHSPLTLSLGPFLPSGMGSEDNDVVGLEARFAGTYEVRYYHDGPAASVAVIGQKEGDAQSLRVDGEIQSSSGVASADLPVHLLLGHLPMLARPGAATALFLDCPSGIAVGALARHASLKSITCLAPSGELLQPSSLFARENRRCLEDPRVVEAVGGARSHLRHTAQRYDIIVAQPPSPWAWGAGGAYSQDGFRLMERVLAPRGVACQWLIAARLGREEFQAILRTFQSVFPYTSVWAAGRHALLLGSREELSFSREAIQAAMEDKGVREDMALLGINGPEAIFRYHRLGPAAARKLADEGWVEVDRRPRLEVSTPPGLLDRERVTEVSALLSGNLEPAGERLQGFEASAAEVEAYRRGGALLQDLDTQISRGQFAVALGQILAVQLERDPWLSEAVAQLVLRYDFALRSTGLKEDWRVFLRRMLLARGRHGFGKPGELKPLRVKAAAQKAVNSDWTAHLLLAHTCLERKDVAGAREALAEAERRGAPRSLLDQMRGFLFSLEGDHLKAEQSYHQALEEAQEAERGEILYNLGFARESRKDYQGAVEYQRRALEAGADRVRSGVAVARCLRALGKPGEAFVAAEAASKAGESAEAFYQAALSLLEQGDRSGALTWMAQAAAAAPERFLRELEELEAMKE